MEIDTEMAEGNFEMNIFDRQAMYKSLALAETLSRVSMLTSPAAKRRLAARSAEMKFGHLDNISGCFVPPKEVLLYLVRMGSFNSAPKILNEDCQDSDLSLPNRIDRQDLLRLCHTNSNGFPIIRRKFHMLKSHPDDESNEYIPDSYDRDPNTIRVLQWNILSQALGVMNDHFVKCPEKALDWNFRKYKIIQGIVEYSPDVICLQEVDHFNFLKTVLGSQGYQGVFFPKPDSPCFYIPDNNGPDGCAIFYKANKFDLVKFETRILEVWSVQSNQVAILVILKDRVSEKEVCVATTHLKARSGALLSTLRNEQGKDLLNFVYENCEKRPVLLCGDFNAEPIEPIYKTVMTHDIGLSSAYADSQLPTSGFTSGEPPYTTWKIREEGEVCHTLDYVFYSKRFLELQGVVDFPTGDEIGPDRVPSYAYPSDHFSLICDFKLKDC